MRPRRTHLATAALLLVCWASACAGTNSESGTDQSSDRIQAEHLSTVSATDFDATNFDNPTTHHRRRYRKEAQAPHFARRVATLGEGGSLRGRPLMAKTLAPPPTDKRVWRRLLRRVHPAHGGDSGLFAWAGALREHVAGDGPELGPPSLGPLLHPPRTGERVPFSGAASFSDLSRRAVEKAEGIGELGSRCGAFSRTAAPCSLLTATRMASKGFRPHP
jgi:hypothetical protein